VLGGAAAAAIRNRPAGQPQASTGVPLRGALRAREFWVLYATLALSGFGCFVPLVHLGPYATDAGHPEAFGVLLVSLIGLGSLLGRFAVGAFADRVGRLRALALMYLGMALMLLLWWASSGTAALSLMAVGFGICYGGFVATFPSVVMDLFGARSVAGIIGCLYTAAGLGTLLGPPLAGAAYDASGSYTVPILGAALLALIAAAGVAALPRLRGAPAP
jgi:predicted MFS family arabinose efflux permease